MLTRRTCLKALGIPFLGLISFVAKAAEKKRSIVNIKIQIDFELEQVFEIGQISIYENPKKVQTTYIDLEYDDNTVDKYWSQKQSVWEELPSVAKYFKDWSKIKGSIKLVHMNRIYYSITKIKVEGSKIYIMVEDDDHNHNYVVVFNSCIRIVS